MLPSLSLATPGPSVSASVLSPLVSETLASSNEHHLELVGENGGCKCWRQRGTLAVFYNRVPKCGSTTMVNFMDEACQAKGEWAGKPWTGFTFVQSTDFDANHFHPDYRTRQQIVWKMSGQANYLKGVEKHQGRSERDHDDDEDNDPEYESLRGGAVVLLGEQGDERDFTDWGQGCVLPPLVWLTPRMKFSTPRRLRGWAGPGRGSSRARRRGRGSR